MQAYLTLENIQRSGCEYIYFYLKPKHIKKSDYFLRQFM